MAKKSSIAKNNHRIKMVAKYAGKRERLLAIAKDMSLPGEERFAARLKLSELPRDSMAIRVRNRCAITGRPRGNYRKFGMSRIAFRELASVGLIPGVVKSSW